jgi:hypothetical protein
MSYTDKQQELLRSLDYVEPEMIAGAVRRIDEKKSRVAVTKKKTNLFLKLAPAIAACLVLLTIALPTANLITEYQEYTPPLFGVDGSGAEVEATPEYDGSRGLLYEINEDGTEAFCTGWGTCTDEVVYIASHYDGLPVTSVYNKGFLEASKITADHPFQNKYVKKLVISDTVVYVEKEFIRQCPNIESVYFGASVEYIPTLPWPVGYGENFATVEVSPNNPYYSSKGNCVVDLRIKELVLATPTTVIPDDGSVEIIGWWSFCSAKNGLTSIVIPEGVKIISASAFTLCMKLESVTLPDSLEFIETGAFDFCASLKTLTIGANLRSIDQNTFHQKYCPVIYFKGTVAEWEAIAKTISGNAKSPATVICTNGETTSVSGNQNNCWWQRLPEYAELHEAYVDIHFSKKYDKYIPHTSSAAEIETANN